MKRSTPASPALLATLSMATLIAGTLPGAALAQDEGGLYIADSRFSFEQAAKRGLAQNPHGRRFFLLVLPPNTGTVTDAASKTAAALRDQVLGQGGVILVCQRDVDKGTVDAAKLAQGVVPVRGFPPPGSNAIPQGERYYPGENPDRLPRSNEALRRLRSACS